MCYRKYYFEALHFSWCKSGKILKIAFDIYSNVQATYNLPAAKDFSSIATAVLQYY